MQVVLPSSAEKENFLSWRVSFHPEFNSVLFVFKSTQCFESDTVSYEQNVLQKVF